MVYKQIVNAETLSDVIAMPQIFRNKRIEVSYGKPPWPRPRPK